MAEGPDEPGGIAAVAQVAGGDPAGAVDRALDLPALVELGEVAGLRVGQAGRGDVEEPVEVDAQRAVHQPAVQLSRGDPPERAVQRVGGGERVVHRVPVAEVVLHVEARDAERRRVRERAPELRGVGTGLDRVEERVDDVLGMLVEELPREPGDVGEAAVAGGARGDGGVEPGLRLGDQHRQVLRMSPGAALLRPGRGGGTAHHRGEHVGCGLLAHVPERLERLVGEVDGVPAVDEDVVGDGGEHHALHVADRARFRQRGREHELGRVARTGLDEAAVPLGEPDPFDLAAVVERAQGEARRVVAGVAGDEREPVHQRQRTVAAHRAWGARSPSR